MPPLVLKAPILLSKSRAVAESEVGVSVSGTGSVGALGSDNELMLFSR